MIRRLFFFSFLLLATGCGSRSSSGGDDQTSTRAPLANCTAPTRITAADEDNTADAAGVGQLFERISVPGITSDTFDTEGSALVDIDGDGLLDVFLSTEDKQGDGHVDSVRLFLNKGCFDFEQQPVTLLGDDVGLRGIEIPVFTDFNDDGLLDWFITSQNRRPNRLFLARGNPYTFENVADTVDVLGGAANERQSQIADLNNDGWPDIVISSGQIGSRVTEGGDNQSFMYVYQPSASGKFEDGRFVNVGGTDLIPDFGAPPTCDPTIERSSAGVLVRDLDDDGDMDVVQPAHVDMNLSRWDDACASGEQRHGVWAWKNLLKETGTFGFEKQTPEGGLAEEARNKYNPITQVYDPVGSAVSHPYINSADVDNDGDLDIITIGPTDPEWHVQTDRIAGKFWRNDGGFRFTARTEEQGLDSLNWFYNKWANFWGAGTLLPTSEIQALGCLTSNQIPKCVLLTSGEHHFYMADAIFADFNNDGWLDLVIADRHEAFTEWGKLRNVLLMNRGDGTFEPLTTDVSGIDANSIAGEAADLNNDGLVDLLLNASFNNSYPVFRDVPGLVPDERKMNKLYWNTGQLGGSDNHWLKVQLTGRLQRRLIGTKLLLRDAGSGILLGRRDYFPVDSYKSSHGYEMHFGLGQHQNVKLELILPDGQIKTISSIPVDNLIRIDVGTGAVDMPMVPRSPRLDPTGAQ